MSRRKSRILAFQALYSWDVSKAPIEDILNFSWLQKDSEIKAGLEQAEPSENLKDEETFASLIIAGTIDHVDEIDKVIESYLSDNWKLDRINKVALAILRTAAYEILFQKDIDPKISIDEAVHIAREYGTDDSYKFINAVLDKIGKNERNKEA
ncbi:MAG: transcription antitermination factor NusB [Treponema sp.]|nr:transcription antitermination factor NusB [Treponema sp.]